MFCLPAAQHSQAYLCCCDALGRFFAPCALQYYDLPVVSVRAAAWRLMLAGIDGFKVLSCMGHWLRWPACLHAILNAFVLSD